MPHSQATLIGFLAVLFWALLAPTTVMAGRVPPFQLTAMSFFIGGLIGVFYMIGKRKPFMPLLRQPWRVWFVGIGGLASYHLLYFTALKWAPPAQANLINALWPLLIVLSSVVILKQPLLPRHILGALLGFGGVIVLAWGGEGMHFQNHFIIGYGLAFLCALVWTAYSLATRTLGRVPTEAVTLYCLATAVIAAGVHCGVETTLWPLTFREWLGVVLMGTGPIGIAFFAWDYGMKHGDIRLLGACAYITPVLATSILVLAGYTPASLALFGACLMIVCGAIIASGVYRRLQRGAL